MIYIIKNLKPFLVFFIVLLLNSCGKEQNDITYFRGQTPDLMNDSIFLYSVDSFHPGIESEYALSATTCDEAGNFLFELKDLQEGYYQLITSKYPRLANDLFVALESDKKQIEAWKNFISGNTEQFNNPELSAYKLNFAPTYVLIDQEDNMVDPRAKRPSEIADDINQLLQQTN